MLQKHTKHSRSKNITQWKWKKKNVTKHNRSVFGESLVQIWQKPKYKKDSTDTRFKRRRGGCIGIGDTDARLLFTPRLFLHVIVSPKNTCVVFSEILSCCRHEKNGQKLGYSRFSLVSLYWNATRNHLRAVDKDNVSLLIDKGSLSQYRASIWSQTLRATSTLWARFVFWVSKRIYMSLNYHKLIFQLVCIQGPVA